MAKKIHFAVDIDQTICGSNAFEVYAKFHNEDLKLEITEDTLNKLSSYRDFFFLPKVEAFHKANEKEWNASRHRAIATPWVIEAFQPIEGAIKGIKALAQYGTIQYYTVRTPGIREATERWLAQYDFPESQNVICCSSIEQKMRTLAHHEPRDEPIILIDDRGHTHFLTLLQRFQGERDIEALLERLTIFAFGTSTIHIPERAICPLFALPYWNTLPTLIIDLEAESVK